MPADDLAARACRCGPRQICLRRRAEHALAQRRRLHRRNLAHDAHGDRCNPRLIGHSERRQYFNETDTTVNLKLKAASPMGSYPSSASASTWTSANGNLTADVLNSRSPSPSKASIRQHSAPLVIAYEPVWAIGTGRRLRRRSPKTRTRSSAHRSRSIAGSDDRRLHTHPLRRLREAGQRRDRSAAWRTSTARWSAEHPRPASFAQIITNAAQIKSRVNMKAARSMPRRLLYLETI